MGSGVVSCSLDRIIDKEEIVFKDSFDEYLKDMESVKQKKLKDIPVLLELNEKYEGIGVCERWWELEFGMVKNQKRKSVSKERHVDEMVSTEREAFKSMDGDAYDKPRVTKAEMEDRIQKLAKGLNDADIDTPEWMFSQIMRSAQIKFSDHSILRIIQILGRLGNWRRVLQVIEWLRSCELFKSHKLRYIYTAALDALGKARRPVEALNLFHAMQVLNACARRKSWEGTFWVLQHLKLWDRHPSITTYGLVVEFEYGQYNLVHDFFKKMQKSCVPNALTYKVLVNTLWKEGKTDKALLAVEDMERRRIVSTASLYYELARCLCSAGRCEEALTMEKLCKVATKPLVVTYTGLIQACLDSGDIQSGAYIFNHMDQFCSPNLTTYNIVLKAYLDSGMFEEANQMFFKLLDNGNFISSKLDGKDKVFPDVHTFNLMLDACAAEKKWDDLKFAYSHMLKYEYHCNAKRHIQIVLDSCRTGEVEGLGSGRSGSTSATSQRNVRRAARKRRHCCCPGLCYRLSVCSVAGILWMKFFVENFDRLSDAALFRLLQELSQVVARNDSRILHNLMACCKEFLRTR
ncbi:unnamed protein product [Withania somnifera]